MKTNKEVRDCCGLFQLPDCEVECMKTEFDYDDKCPKCKKIAANCNCGHIMPNPFLTGEQTDDYVMYCEAMAETNDKPLSFKDWQELDKEKHQDD